MESELKQLLVSHSDNHMNYYLSAHFGIHVYSAYLTWADEALAHLNHIDNGGHQDDKKTAPSNQTNRIPIRQPIRWALMIVSLMLFPVTMYYFSPYLSIMGVAEGLISGSIVMFLCQMVAALIFGRAFCGWLYPMARQNNTNIF